MFHGGYLMLFCNSFVNDILILTIDKRLAIKWKAKVCNDKLSKNFHGTNIETVAKEFNSF